MAIQTVSKKTNPELRIHLPSESNSKSLIPLQPKQFLHQLNTILYSPKNTLAQRLFSFCDLTDIKAAILNQATLNFFNTRQIIPNYLASMPAPLTIQIQTQSPIKELKLHDEELTDLQLQGIAERYPNLESLHLGCNSITEQGMLELTKLPKLKSIEILRPKDLQLKSIGKISTLEHLTVTDGRFITNAGIAELRPLFKTLQSFTMGMCWNISDQSFNTFGRFFQLKTLKISSAPITDEGLELLVALDNLRMLHLTYCKHITDEGLSVFKGVPLQDVNLAGSNITGSGLSYFQESPITSLDLSSCENLTDDSLAHIATLPIQQLSLAKCPNITDEGAKHISSLAQLTKLNLNRCEHITDYGISHIAKLSNLQKLNLRRIKGITRIGCRYLSYLKQLNTINLRDIDAIDEGAIKELLAVKNMNETPSLKYIKVQDNVHLLDCIPRHSSNLNIGWFKYKYGFFLLI